MRLTVDVNYITDEQPRNEDGKWSSNASASTAGGLHPGHVVSPIVSKKSSGGANVGRAEQRHTITHVLHNQGMIRAQGPHGFSQFHESQVRKRD